MARIDTSQRGTFMNTSSTPPLLAGSLDEQISADLAASLASGELQSSPAWGRPLPEDGFLETPTELRMAYKVLKNAGYVPDEVALMQELQAWRDQLAGMDPVSKEADELRTRILDRELLVALNIERLARLCRSP